MMAGDFNLSFFPTENLSVVNTTAVTSNRIDGSSIYSEINTGTDLGSHRVLPLPGNPAGHQLHAGELPA